MRKGNGDFRKIGPGDRFRRSGKALGSPGSHQEAIRGNRSLVTGALDKHNLAA